MTILKLCWWYIKILLIGTLIVCISPILLVTFVFCPTVAKGIFLLTLGIIDLGR